MSEMSGQNENPEVQNRDVQNPEMATPKMPDHDVETGDTERARWLVVTIIVAVSVGAGLYRQLRHIGLGHTGAMFLGIPAVLAIMLAFTPKARTVTGAILKGITFALLIVAPLLGEGMVCILFAAPLFYIVGIVVGQIADHTRRRRRATMGCVALVLLPMCLEGVVPQLTLNRSQTVSVTRIVDAPAQAVAQALEQSPRIATPLPLYLRVGFPRPLAARGEGLSVGAMRTIHFSAAEGVPAGDLVMRVTASGAGHARFETVSDVTKLAHWITWDSSEVEWSAIDAARTRVTWRIHFERQLDPAWHFIPWERAAVHESAKYLIQANATPERGAR